MVDWYMYIIYTVRFMQSWFIKVAGFMNSIILYFMITDIRIRGIKKKKKKERRKRTIPANFLSNTLRKQTSCSVWFIILKFIISYPVCNSPDNWHGNLVEINVWITIKVYKSRNKFRNLHVHIIRSKEYILIVFKKTRKTCTFVQLYIYIIL